MAGITRIHIVSDWDEPRQKMAQRSEVRADFIYRDVFDWINCPIQPGTKIIECTKEEVIASYDFREGVDVILNFTNGTKATLQEKYLYPTDRNTITFTEHQKYNKPGNWYTCTADYWFTGYVANYEGGEFGFRNWIIVDFPRLKRLSNTLNWKYGDNHKTGYLGISFRYLEFDEIPEDCIVCSKYEMEVCF